jgi:hypothetical protein
MLKPRRLPVLLALVALALTAAPAAPATITGLCPDGSVFIVQTASAIPCQGAKLVDPDEVPPLRPEYLPSPSTWQVYNQSRSPNNPYNLTELRGSPCAGGAGVEQPARPDGLRRVALPRWRATPPTTTVLLSSAGDQELRDLFQIVQLSQEYAPASFARTADGRGLRGLPYPEAFENRLGSGLRGRPGGGRVLPSRPSPA